MKRFRGGLVFKAHRLLYHSTLGSRVIKKKRKKNLLHINPAADAAEAGKEIANQTIKFPMHQEHTHFLHPARRGKSISPDESAV